MSYSLARARLVSVIKATTPTTKTLGLGAAFVYDPRVDDAVAFSAARHFNLHSRTSRGWGPGRLSVNVERHDLEVLIDYPLPDDRGALDLAIAEDVTALRAALLNQNNWQGSTTGIRVVGAFDSDTLIPAAVDDIAGGRRLRLSLPLEVTT